MFASRIYAPGLTLDKEASRSLQFPAAKLDQLVSQHTAICGRNVII